MIKKGLLILAVAVFSSGGLIYAQLIPLSNIETISGLNEKRPGFGTYNVIGYVSKIYECPSCPQNAVCKPCQPDHIVISENKSMLAKYALTDREMIVFVNNKDGLKLQKKYNFLIQVLDVKTLDQPINNVKLIHFEKVR